MAQIGTTWNQSAWAVPAWAANTWAGAVVPVVTPTSVGTGAWIPFAKRKHERYEKVRDEDFDTDVTPEPLEPAAELALPEIVPPRPTISRGPAMPEAPTFEPPTPWTPATEPDEAIRQRHLARVAAVEAARERNRLAAEAHAQRVADHEARLQAEIAAQHERARSAASTMSLLLQLDDL